MRCGAGSVPIPVAQPAPSASDGERWETGRGPSENPVCFALTVERAGLWW